MEQQCEQFKRVYGAKGTLHKNMYRLLFGLYK